MAASNPAQSAVQASASGNPSLPDPSALWLDRSVLVALLVVALFIRGIILWSLRGNLKEDPDAYREIAEFLLQRGEFAIGKLSPLEGASRPVATAFRPPLYPIVLSNLPAENREQISMPKVAVLHLGLGLTTVWLTWATARSVGQAAVGRFAALCNPTIAGLLVACDPILLNQQTLIMTETLATFLAVLSLWCLARIDSTRTPFNAALAGGAIGLAVLCRPTFLPWLGLVGITMLFVRGGRPLKSQISSLNFVNIPWRLANLAGLAIVAAAVISPWAIRNYREWGKPLITTTHGGYTFYLANNDQFYEWLTHDRTVPWDARGFNNQLGLFLRSPTVAGEKKEFLYDKFCYRNAWQTIHRQPDIFLRACGYRLYQLWSPLPHQLTAIESVQRRCLRYATCAWYCGVYALAAIGIWRLRWRLFQPPWIWGVLLCLAFAAVHTFYWTNLRMRAPLMPFVALVAAAGVPRRLCFRITNGVSTKEGYAKA